MLMENLLIFLPFMLLIATRKLNKSRLAKNDAKLPDMEENLLFHNKRHDAQQTLTH